MEEEVIHTLPEDAGERIDKYISTHISGISRSFAVSLLEKQMVLINGKPIAKNYRLRGNEEIIITLPEDEVTEAIPEEIPLDIIYEDSDLLVVNKPQGMVVHPAAGNLTGTLVSALMYHCRGQLSAINGVIRPGIVHRIDKDTSGLLVVAKNNETHLHLAEQIKEHKAGRHYYALVNGRVKEDGTIDRPIARHPVDRKKMAIVANGREAITHYKVLEEFLGYTLVECILETGRTHQIRVHMASIGHSIVGDKTYGIKKEHFSLQGQLLHACTICFEHPKTGETMEFSAPLPEYFSDVLNKLRKIHETSMNNLE